MNYGPTSDEPVEKLAGCEPTGKPGSLLTSPALAAAGLVVLATLLRLLAGLDDFWLDEIWSWDFARQARSPLDVFSIHHDNNHKLVTLWMRLAGDADHWFVYRIPSLLTGIGAVLVAGQLGRRRGKLDGLLALLLTGTSFLLIQYSSEARGYAPAIFFAYLGWWCLQRSAERPGLAGIGFAACVGLGLLSHLTYLHFYLGTLMWSAVRLFRERSHGRMAVLGFARLHALPLVFLGLLYWIDVRHLVIGGGERHSIHSVLLGGLSLSGGGPGGGTGAMAGAMVSAVVLAAGLTRLRREGSDAWALYGGTILAAPGLILAAARPEVLYVRYLIVPAAFLLLLAAFVLARLWERGGGARLAAAGVLVLMTTGNLVQIAHLATLGRGGYLRAVGRMTENTPGPVVTVGSDHDMRNGMVLMFYRRYLPEGKRLEYVSRAELSGRPPDWFLLHRFAGVSAPPATERLAGEQPYALVEVFPYAGLSGWTWYLYRRIGGS